MTEGRYLNFRGVGYTESVDDWRARMMKDTPILAEVIEVLEPFAEWARDHADEIAEFGHWKIIGDDEHSATVSDLYTARDLLTRLRSLDRDALVLAAGREGEAEAVNMVREDDHAPNMRTELLAYICRYSATAGARAAIDALMGETDGR